jgi:RHS repeat-associated protein
VQYWNNSSWVTVPGGSVTGNNKVWRKFTFSPVTTNKIRVLINSVPDAWSRVVEIQAFGTSAGGEKVQWLVPDHLGTPRIIVDETGSRANVKRHDYLPFGEELFAGSGGRSAAQGYAGDGVRQQFTQKERDNETTLDYFLARYYASVQGRFTSADEFLNDTLVSDPASWNLYVYGRNNPLVFTDPTGEMVNGNGFSDRERQQIINDWKQKTGYVDIHFDSNNNLVINHDAGIAIGPDGKFLGSADMRANLTDAVESGDIFNLVATNSSDNVAFAENELVLTTRNAQTNVTTRTYEVRIDFDDFRNLEGDEQAKGAFTIGIAAMHEIDHKLYGNKEDTPNDLTDPGPIEKNYINPMRAQLGLAQRVHYRATAAGPQQIPYRELRFRLDGRDRLLRWKHRTVGGREE